MNKNELEPKQFVTPDDQFELVTHINRYIWVTTEADIQQYAYDEFGRTLTDIQLNRLANCFRTLDDKVMDSLFQLYKDAINFVLNSKEDWKAIDNEFKKK